MIIATLKMPGSPFCHSSFFFKAPRRGDPAQNTDRFSGQKSGRPDVVFCCCFLGKDADGLSDGAVADWALGLVPLADAVGTLHAEEVVAAGHERRDDLALEANRAVAAAFPTQPGRGAGRAGGRTRGGGGRRRAVGGQVAAQPVGVEWVGARGR
uniref:Uncharacterized protein n=1 Tax=Micrurus surinamensis TaxID=129470 RepID=A0A2D4P0F7_MICSU